MSKLDPVTPGELLLEEFLRPMGISQYRLAKAIEVPAQRIGEIVAGKRSVTADTDLRLCRYVGLSSGYWLRAQVAYDTEVAEKELRAVLKRIKPWASDAAEQGGASDGWKDARQYASAGAESVPLTDGRLHGLMWP